MAYATGDVQEQPTVLLGLIEERLRRLNHIEKNYRKSRNAEIC